MAKNKKNKLKKKKISDTQKVQQLPETYIEDTFELDAPVVKETERSIKNPVKIKLDEYITKDTLLKQQQFNNKLTKLKNLIEYNKSFAILLDFATMSKLYNHVKIDKQTDEFDILLYELVIHFKKKLTRIELTYKVYQEINDYLDTLKILYNQFKNSEIVDNELLKNKLIKLQDQESFISYYLF